MDRRCFEQHPRFGLAAGAGISIVVKAAVQQVDTRQLLPQCTIDVVGNVSGERAAGDVWLIRDYDEHEPESFERRQTLRHARQNLELLNRHGRMGHAVTEVGAIQCPVTVQENRRSSFAQVAQVTDSHLVGAALRRG